MAALLPKIDASRSSLPKIDATQSHARGSQSARSARHDGSQEIEQKWKAERRWMMDRLEQEARSRHVLSKQLQMREEGVSRMQSENLRTVERLQMQIQNLRNGREEILLSIQDKDRALEEERSFRFALETRIADLLTDGLQVSEKLTIQDILQFTGLSRTPGAVVDSQAVALRQPNASKKPKPALDGCCCACHLPAKWGESSLLEEQSEGDLPHFLLQSRESSADDAFNLQGDDMDPSDLIGRLVTVWRKEKMEAVANARAQREALDHVCLKLQEEVARLQGELGHLRERDREHEAAVARLQRESQALREERDHAQDQARIMATRSVEKASDSDRVGTENDDLRRAVVTLQHERDFLQSQTDQMGKNLASLKAGLAWKGQFQQVLVGLKGMMDIFKEFETKVTFGLVELGNRIEKLKLRLDAQDIMRHNRDSLPPPGNAIAGDPDAQSQSRRPSKCKGEVGGERSPSKERPESKALCWKHVVLEDPRNAPLVLAELDLTHLQQKSLADLFKKAASSGHSATVVGSTREQYDVQKRIEAVNFAQCVLNDVLSTTQAVDAYQMWSTFVKKHVVHAESSMSSGKSPLSKDAFSNIVKAALAALYEQFPGMSLASFQTTLSPKNARRRGSSEVQETVSEEPEKTALDEVLEVEGEEAELLMVRDKREKFGYSVKDNKNWKQSRAAANSKVYGYALGLPGRPRMR